MEASFITISDKREETIVQFLPLVRHLVGKLAIHLPSFVDTEDLVEAGIIGVIAAVDSYQSSRGASLKTYVYTRAKGAILDEIRKLSCFSRDFHKKLKKLQEIYQTLEEKLGHAPSLDEIAKAMAITHEELGELLTAVHGQTVFSLDKSFASNPDKEEDCLLSMLACPKSEMPDQVAERHELEQNLANAIQKLPERERQIIVLYYYQGLLLQEVSDLLKISPGRVSHLHARALYRINEALKLVKEPIKA